MIGIVRQDTALLVGLLTSYSTFCDDVFGETSTPDCTATAEQDLPTKHPSKFLICIPIQLRVRFDILFLFFFFFDIQNKLSG